MNSGIPVSLNGSIGKIVKAIFVLPFAADGTSNAIDLSDTIDAAYVTAKLNEPDPTKRWYPSDKIESIINERATSVTEAVGNLTLNVEKGVRTFQGVFIGTVSSSPTYLKFLESLECQKVMVFYIDECGNLIGEQKTEGFLDGIYIQEKSVSSLNIPQTDSTLPKNQINYTIDQLVKDSRLNFVKACDITGVDLLSITGLLDVTLIESSIAPNLTDVTIEGKLIYGNAKTKLDYIGATDPSDWVVNNTTTPSTITVLTVTESPEGTYNLTFAAQTALDEISVKASNEGFESNLLTGVVLS
jgi:hypothetical protein